MEYDIIIVGGGPAGIRAAISLRQNTEYRILLLEMEKSLGGALRDIIEEDPSFGSEGTTGVELADDLIQKVNELKIEYRTAAQVLSVEKDLTLSVLTMDSGIVDFKAGAVIFATGSRERPRGILNFTSNRSTGIFSVGTARKFIVKEGYLPGKNAVIYGSDFTGLYLAKILMTEGAESVTLVDPQKEIRYPDEELKKTLEILGVKERPGHILTDISGKERITGIAVGEGGNVELIPCDTLLLSVGLSPQKSLFKKFRRDPEKSGVFVTGNADQVSFNMDETMRNAWEISKKAADFLSGKKEERLL